MRVGKSWCQRRELNPRPKAYESSALPLSYSGSRPPDYFPDKSPAVKRIDGTLAPAANLGRRPRRAIGLADAVYAIRMVNPPSIVKVSPVR